MPAEKPKILFLMADEHRHDVLGFQGDPIVRTPTLDWLADTGVVFENCYTPSPICVPMRQCMAAGQLPRTCGVEDYGQDLPPFSMTFARRLSQYGYLTVCCGKLHHDGPDQMQGWMRRIGANCRITPKYIQDRDEASWAARPSRDDPYQLVGKDAWNIQRAGVGRGSSTHVADELALLGAQRFIECHFQDPYYIRAHPAEPLLLKVSFNRPHYPYLTNEELFTYYLNRVEPKLQSERFDHPVLGSRSVVPGRDVTEQEIRRATAAYYGMVEEVDRDFGSVLERLQHVGEDLDDWIIVYLADHGEMLGDHGVWEKTVFFEQSVKVPLIIRYPRRFAPNRVKQNVNLCDLFATLCELTGTPVPEPAETVNGAGLDSRSLVGLCDVGDSAAWDNETVSQIRGTDLMIKRDDLKYQLYQRPSCRDCPEVLFDLAADPEERRNAIDDPRHAEAVAAFRRRAAELRFDPPR
ncbi:MAG: sulfatase-like hydrolase/transferase [Phycisphaerae bacterium]